MALKTEDIVPLPDEPRLSNEEVGANEMWNVLTACKRFESLTAAQWHAERYGRMAVNKIHFVLHDIRMRQQGNKTCDTALDAYNFARLAHHGWRALRGL